jgi:hypothetical protein
VLSISGSRARVASRGMEKAGLSDAQIELAELDYCQEKKEPETLSGVLVVPGKMPLEQWSAAAAIQQSKYRVKNVDDELG